MGVEIRGRARSHQGGRMAINGHPETGAGFGKIRTRQPFLLANGDHAIDSIAQTLDKSHFGKHLHNSLVAAVTLIHQIIQGDMARQTPGRIYLHAIAEHQHADIIPANAVIPMRHCVDDGLPHHRDGILGDFLSLKAADAHAAAHVGGDKGLGPADLIGQHPANILADKIITHGLSGITHAGDLGGAQPALGIAAKQEQPGNGGT